MFFPIAHVIDNQSNYFLNFQFVHNILEWSHMNDLSHNFRGQFQLKSDRQYVPYFLASENVRLELF